MAEPGLNESEGHMECVFEVARILRGVIFNGTAMFDSDGALLFDATGVLAELEQICLDLERKAREMLQQLPDADPDFAFSLAPGAPGASAADIERLERAVGRELPASMREAMASYEVGGLELCGVVFGAGASFCDFLWRQVQQPHLLWGDWQRVSDLLVIGSSTGHVLFVGIGDGRVWACPRDHSIEERTVIANDFVGLLRALGTLALKEAVEDEDALAVSIARAVGAEDSNAFWFERIKGYG